MKTLKCIIQLTFVPESIYKGSGGDIDSGMYLRRSAVDSLLKGEMFSGLDCFWGSAEMVPEKDANQARMQLMNFGLTASVITII